jgi:hypothetical protein
MFIQTGIYIFYSGLCNGPNVKKIPGEVKPNEIHVFLLIESPFIGKMKSKVVSQ